MDATTEDVFVVTKKKAEWRRLAEVNRQGSKEYSI
jgi:hypothetical protein